MSKRSLTLIVLVCLALAAAGVAYWRYQESHKLSWQRAAGMKLSGYSLQGTVESVGKGEITVVVGRVEATPTGNQFVSYEKTFALADTLSFKRASSTQSVAAAALATYLKARDSAVFYGSGTTSPWTGAFTVERVELLQSGSASPALPSGAPAAESSHSSL